MAGRIPQSFINDLIDRVDIVDVVGSRITLKKTGKNYSALCPFHDEKTPSFSVSPDKQFFHCFGCQESGTALGFIMKYDRLEFVEAVEVLAKQLGLEIPREASRGSVRKVDESLYAVLARAERFFRQSLRGASEAIGYLQERGVSGEVARDFGIGYAPPGWQNLADALSDLKPEQLLAAGLVTKNDQGRTYDRFRDRIMFPIRDTRGRVVAFGGRTMGGDDGPKYLNSPETDVFQKSHELYGLYEARKALRQITRLVLVEGYMDVVALAQSGIQNAVATLGTASGTPHFTKLYRYTDQVVCCFDGDEAGRQAAWKALENALPALDAHRQLKFVFLPQGEDPDTMVRRVGRADFEQLLDNAQPAMELMLSRLSSGLDLDTIDGQARFAALAEPYVARLPEGTLRSLVAGRVAAMSGRSVSARAVEAAPRRGATQPTKSQDSALSKLSERLLTLLVQQPQAWPHIDADVRDVLARLSPDTPLGEVVAYLAQHPEAETEEMLVWFDEPGTADAVRRALNRHLGLAAAELVSEAGECAVRLVTQLRARERRAMLESLKNSPNDEVLRTYFDKRKLGDDYA